MRIAVISDTHLYSPTPWLEAVYARRLAPADALIHCGDVNGEATYQWLSAMHPQFYCAQGNTDVALVGMPGVVPLAVFDIGGLTVGLTHGWGPKPDLPGTALTAIAEAGHALDLLCFGHTHVFHWQAHTVQGRTVQALNPGSLQEPSPSMAELTVHDDGTLEARHLRGEAIFAS